MQLISLLVIATVMTPSQDVPVILPTGSIEAPAAPFRRSRARYQRTKRTVAPVLAGSTGVLAAPIRNLVGIRGQEENIIWGLGLVDGLAGTGDSSAVIKQLMRNGYLSRNINVDESSLSSKNAAVVRVEASLPAGIKAGQPISVRVSANQDAKSLRGGTLLLMELQGMDGQVYATASGPITVGGFSFEGEAASTTRNHPTVGTIPLGGKVERSVPTQLINDEGFLYLDAKPAYAEMGNMIRICDAVNLMWPRTSTVTPDGKTVEVRVPGDIPVAQHSHFMYQIMKTRVDTENVARVVINERNGTIVMGGDIMLRACIVARGGITVTIAETREVSQPAFGSGGVTVPVERTDLTVVEENNPLIMLPNAASLREVVDVLNALNATPNEVISILTALQDGGHLVAEIRRM